MSDKRTEHPLDNVVWNALQTDQTDLSQVSDDRHAARYLPDVGPFAGFSDPDSPSWSGLSEIMGPGEFNLLLLPEAQDTPAGLGLLSSEVATQYVAERLDDRELPEFLPLSTQDLSEIMELVEIAPPGPFGPRTLETGRYIGLRREGRLIAMAGERMRCPGWVEVSAVCVHPSAQGEGLGASLTLAVAHRVRAEGNEAMLHVREGNDAAHSLYQKIGFRLRREFWAAAFGKVTVPG
jgi:GNAT superfamily N-acetyltransferase